MGASSVTLHFPFRIDGKEHTVEISTEVLRDENVVSFMLGFSALITVDTKHGYSVHYSKSIQTSTAVNVCIKFKSINDAIAFYKAPSVHLSYTPSTSLVSVDKELERVTAELEQEKGPWRKRKSQRDVDDEGYTLC